jgi:hypothetical protein
VLLVRAIAMACPPPALESCLRGAYRAFAQNAKFVTAASAPHINFMGAAVVELTRIDAGAAGRILRARALEGKASATLDLRAAPAAVLAAPGPFLPPNGASAARAGSARR